MVGYSYFDYDQMILLGIEVHSDELELLQQAADTYDWKAIETGLEPKFKEAAMDFRDGKHSFACPRKDELDEDLQESFPFLDEMARTEGCRIQNEEMMKMEEGLGRSPPQKGEFAEKVAFFVNSTAEVL